MKDLHSDVPFKRRKKAEDPKELASQLAQNTKKTDGFVYLTQYDNLVVNNDWTDAMQAAIDYVYSTWGGGEVRVPLGEYLIAQQKGTVKIPTSDDGTVQSGYGTAMTAEPENFIPYCVKMKQGVKIVGLDNNKSVLKGDYVYGNADLNQKIMFSFVGETSGSAVYYNGLRNIQIKNSFIGFACLDNTLALAEFEKLKFSSNAISIYAQVLERCRFDEIEGLSSGSILTVGGQWRTRNDNYNEKGGFADKCYFNKITFNYGRIAGTSEQNIDTFFDTYFFKTANNDTRLSSPIQASSIAKILKYRGICGTAINILPRYWRNSVNNEFKNFFVAYTQRYGIYAGNLINCSLDNINFESCGYKDNVNHTDGVGSATFTDSYLGSNVRLPSLIVGTDTTCLASNIQLQNCYVDKALDDFVKYINLKVFPNSLVNTALPTSRLDAITLSSPTLNTPTISGGSITADVTAGYYFIGDNSGFVSVPVTSGTGTRTLTIPSNGVYLINVMASGNGGYDHVISQSAIVTFLKGGTYSALGTDMLGSAKKAPGSNAPTGISLSAPDANGVVTATATGCPTANVFIRFDITKLSKV